MIGDPTRPRRVRSANAAVVSCSMKRYSRVGQRTCRDRLQACLLLVAKHRDAPRLQIVPSGQLPALMAQSIHQAPYEISAIRWKIRLDCTFTGVIDDDRWKTVPQRENNATVSQNAPSLHILYYCTTVSACSLSTYAYDTSRPLLCHMVPRVLANMQSLVVQPKLCSVSSASYIETVDLARSV
jgi:hypothetical protein